LPAETSANVKLTNARPIALAADRAANVICEVIE
jgi:hypothetical protein